MKKWSRVLSLGLCLVLTLSLCSCGKNTLSKQEEEARKAAAKQGVFKEELLDIGIDFNEVGVTSFDVVDKTLKIVYQVWESYEDGEDVILDMVNPRMGLIDEAVIEVATEEAVEEVTDEAEVTEEAVEYEAEVADVFIDAVLPDIEVDPGFGVVPVSRNLYHYMTYNLDTKESTDIVLNDDFTTAEGVNIGSQGWLGNVFFGKDGNLYGVKEIYFEDYSDPENYIFEQYYYLICWDETGYVKYATSLLGEEETYFYARNINVDENGNVSILGGEGIFIELDSEGAILSRNKAENEILQFANIITVREDNNWNVVHYNEEYTKMFVSVFNPKSGEVVSKTELPGSMTNVTFYPAVGYDFIVSTNNGLSTYNVGDADKTPYMNFVNSDLPVSYFDRVIMIDDKTVLTMYYDSLDWRQRLSLFTYVDPSTIVDKEVITLAGMYISNDVMRQIIDFNKTNPSYRVTVKNYSEYNTMDDYMAGYTKLNNDIISGQVPDILLTNTNMNVLNYANKGLLLDIYELLNADEELSKNEYLTNAWDSFVVDGKLYNIFPSFTVLTYIGKKSMVGDKNGWTTAEFMEAVKKLPEDGMAFGYQMTKADFMYYVMNFCATDYIDLESGICNFDSPSFKLLLEYANSLPKEFTEEYWDDYYSDYDYMEYNLRYRNNKCLVADAYISSIRDLVYQIHGMMGEDVSFVGFPSGDGTGHIISPNGAGFAISSKTPYVDGCWEFVREYFTEEYQSELSYTLPVLKEAFLEQAKEATKKPYWTNEEGEKVEYDDYFDLNGEQIILEPFTQEEVDAICEFIYTVKDTGYNNENITNIITEEAQAYFEGKKTVDEVAKIIQSRVQVYVDENQ